MYENPQDQPSEAFSRQRQVMAALTRGRERARELAQQGPLEPGQPEMDASHVPYPPPTSEPPTDPITSDGQDSQAE